MSGRNTTSIRKTPSFQSYIDIYSEERKNEVHVQTDEQVRLEKSRLNFRASGKPLTCLVPVAVDGGSGGVEDSSRSGDPATRNVVGGINDWLIVCADANNKVLSSNNGSDSSRNLSIASDESTLSPGSDTASTAAFSSIDMTTTGPSILSKTQFPQPAPRLRPITSQPLIDVTPQDGTESLAGQSQIGPLDWANNLSVLEGPSGIGLSSTSHAMSQSDRRQQSQGSTSSGSTGDVSTVEGGSVSINPASRVANDAKCSTESDAMNLCGYLKKHKLGARHSLIAAGLPKIFKRRWFVYSDSTCSLFYYRTHHDMIPLGEINVAHAAFTFDIITNNRANIFEIRTGEKTCWLEAEDRHTMLYWLQQLQQRRKDFRRRTGTGGGVGKKDGGVANNNCGTGLALFGTTAGQHVASERLSPPRHRGGDQVACEEGGRGEGRREDETDDLGLLDHVPVPERTVGRRSTEYGGVGGGSLRDLSITNWRVELRNILSNIGPNASGHRQRMSKLSKDSSSSINISTSLDEDVLIDLPAPTSGDVYPSPSSSSSSTTRFALPQPNLSGTIHSFRNRLRLGGNRDRDRDRVTPLDGGGRAATRSISDTTNACDNCKQLEEVGRSAREDLENLEDQLSATTEVVAVLKRHADTLQRQLDSVKTLIGDDGCSVGEAQQQKKDGTTNLLDMILARDDRIVSLEHMISDSREQEAILNSGLLDKSNELKCAHEENHMYVENLLLKEQMILSLTDQITQLEQSRGPDLGPAVARQSQAAGPGVSLETRPGHAPGPFGGSQAMGVVNLQARQLMNMKLELEQLQDKCSAYEMQNKFLNQEILEVDQLLKDEEARTDWLTRQLSTSQARYIQVQSKHLFCLKELAKPAPGGGGVYDQEIVSRLLEEAIVSYEEAIDVGAIQSLPANALSGFSSGSGDAYDEFGFSRKSRDDVDHTTDPANIEQFAEKLKHHSQQIQNSIPCTGPDVVSVAVKFERYLVSSVDRPLARSEELKQLIRDGVPSQLRGRVWKSCIHLRCANLMKSATLKNYYKGLLLKTSLSSYRVYHQVEIDLLRTLPNNKHYATAESDGITRLRNVLLAFSVHAPKVGYCQGLNRLVAILLLFLDEEDAFWGLVTIVERLLPDRYYDHTLIAAHADQRVLKDLVADKLPQISAHFSANKFDLSLFTFSWFLTIFVDNIPVQTYLRIWDTFLYEGSKVLFRYAVAMLKYYEETILSKRDTNSLHSFMRSLGETLTDINRISHIAFHDINPFPMRAINSKRQQHMLKLESELAELEAMRRSFEAASIHRQDVKSSATITSSEFMSDDEQ